MVAPLKYRGLDELQSLIRRNRRLFSLGRTEEEDFTYIDKRLCEVEVRIIEMHEQTNADSTRPF